MSRTVVCNYAKALTLSALVCVALFSTALAQKPATPEAEGKQEPKESKPAATKRPYVVKVHTSPLLNISVNADKAKMSDVAQEISKQLKVPVFLGTERRNELLTIEFHELPLEPALQLLSPTVYVDYEIDTGSGAPPKPLGIYFFDANQGEPPLTAVVNGSTQAMLIEGNTEDDVESEGDDDKEKRDEQPLKVTFKDNYLSVKAKKQPLVLVLLKIGEELGIPIDIQDQSAAVIDAEFSKLPVEDLVRQLSPHIRLYIRADLTRAERRALRLVLAEPPKTTQ